jgi:aspartate racemase
LVDDRGSGRRVIGVVGGMGPYAGLDLVRKIFDQTTASTDQEHLDVILLSTPSVPDRTGFLLEGRGGNPAPHIAAAVRALDAAGASVAGIPCNTAHAPAIFDAVLQDLASTQTRIRLLSLIAETVTFLAGPRAAGRTRLGVLSTTGTLRTQVYSRPLVAAGFSVIEPADDVQRDLVQRAIYDPEYGIKARSNPVTEQARGAVMSAIRHVAERGAQAVLLGCTELLLAVGEATVLGLPVIDPAVALARALIRETHPEKLKPR